MSRQSNKKLYINYENSIKKSNKLSMAKLNQGLTLNQMQLLAYAIFSTQQDGKTEFRKYEFQDKFGIEKYQTMHAKKDAQGLLGLQFSIEDLENDYFEYWNVFSSIRYKNGLFNFRWNEEFIPHILELKDKYVMTDLTVTAKFKSGFSWILYEYLKANYGYWVKEISKEALMKLFAVENRKSYMKSAAQFKRGVLEVAIDEINEFTELEVWYTEKKTGNKIIAFNIYWSSGKREMKASKKQMGLLREIHDEVDRKMFDYISVKNTYNLELARKNIMKIKEIDEQVNDNLTSQQADEYIKEAKLLYEQLQQLIENDGKERDTSVYFDWTKGEK